MEQPTPPPPTTDTRVTTSLVAFCFLFILVLTCALLLADDVVAPIKERSIGLLLARHVQHQGNPSLSRVCSSGH